MEFWTDYGLFLAKLLTLLGFVAVAAGLLARTRSGGREPLRVRHLNRRYEAMARTLQAAMLPPRELRALVRRERQAERRRRREGPRRRLFVLGFQGNIQASAVAALREEVTAVLTVARAEDEVVLRLESGGGLMHAYGLAAAQLVRVRERGIPLTVAVDRIAASGGYLMACVANRIIAAPFAVLGSIGVLAQFPNFHRWLKKHDIDFEQFSGGEYKRTVTLFGENTEADRAKFQSEIAEAHALFQEFVSTYRPTLELAQVANGDHWHATRALALGLVDELRTSDDYLLAAYETADLYEVSYRRKLPWTQRFGVTLGELGERLGLASRAATPGRDEH